MFKKLGGFALLTLVLTAAAAQAHGYNAKASYGYSNYATPMLIQSYAPPVATNGYCGAVPTAASSSCQLHAPQVQQEQYQQPVSQVDFGVVHPLPVQTSVQQQYTAPPVQAQVQAYPAANSYGGAAFQQQQYVPQVQAQYSNYGTAQASYGGYAAKAQKVVQYQQYAQPVQQQVVVKKVIQQQQYVPAVQQQYVQVQQQQYVPAVQKIVRQQVIQKVKINKAVQAVNPY